MSNDRDNDTLAASLLPSSLLIPLYGHFPHSSAPVPVMTLIDSGSTHCFIDTKFVETNKLDTKLLPFPIHLRLFDGLSHSEISRSTTFDCTFPDGFVHSIDFFVTNLHPTCSAVLGYSWLTITNPSIDWVSGQITFPAPTTLPIHPTETWLETVVTPQTPSQPSSPLSSLSPSSSYPSPSSLSSLYPSSPSPYPSVLYPSSSPLPSSPPAPPPSLPANPQKPVHVALIGAAAFELAT